VVWIYLLGILSYLNKQSGTSNDFQHCVCPNNFAGTYCEHQLDSCGDGQHLCLHGSKCVGIGDEQLCDCDQADSPLASFFVGSHCEHPVNDICTENSPDSNTPSKLTFGNGMPGAALDFCVNGRTCKEKVPQNEPYAYLATYVFRNTLSILDLCIHCVVYIHFSH
jgi:hypothetical protein